jgi:hypothetical protein
MEPGKLWVKPPIPHTDEYYPMAQINFPIYCHYNSTGEYKISKVPQYRLDMQDSTRHVVIKSYIEHFTPRKSKFINKRRDAYTSMYLMRKLPPEIVRYTKTFIE